MSQTIHLTRRSLILHRLGHCCCAWLVDDVVVEVIFRFSLSIGWLSLSHSFPHFFISHFSLFIGSPLLLFMFAFLFVYDVQPSVYIGI